VYHPNPGDGHAWVNVGFLSWLGAMTGMNDAGISAHEIGVSFPDTTWFGSESFAGIPFVFLLREMLQHDATLDDVITRMTTANRTCDLILGAGSRTDASFRSFAYSASQIHVFDDANLQPWNNTPDTWHPRIPSVVYHGMVRGVGWGGWGGLLSPRTFLALCSRPRARAHNPRPPRLPRVRRRTGTAPASTSRWRSNCRRCTAGSRPRTPSPT
jgi:hypothetical protein